MNIEQ
jgi:hypothetical protein